MSVTFVHEVIDRSIVVLMKNNSSEQASELADVARETSLCFQQ
jgi:hypothetical protein